MGDRSRVQVAFAPFSYLINHSGQLSLAIPRPCKSGTVSISESRGVNSAVSVVSSIHTLFAPGPIRSPERIGQ